MTYTRTHTRRVVGRHAAIIVIFTRRRRRRVCATVFVQWVENEANLFYVQRVRARMGIACLRYYVTGHGRTDGTLCDGDGGGGGE